MLKNAYLLAKIGADTAENERNFVDNLPKIGNYPTSTRSEGPARFFANDRSTGGPGGPNSRDEFFAAALPVASIV